MSEKPDFSHSRKSKKVEPDDKGTDAKLIVKLSEVKSTGNRFLLARIPLFTGEGGGKGSRIRPKASGAGTRRRASHSSRANLTATN